MAKRMAIYLRSATARLPNARAEPSPSCKRLIEALGGELVGVYVDAPASGLSEERSALQALLAAVDNGELDVVLTSDLTHIARNVAMLATICSRLREAGVELRTVGDPHRDAAAAMLEPVEHAYSDLVLRRVFAEAADGRSARDIADGLNKDRISRSKLIRTQDARVRSRYEALGYTNVVVTIEATDKDGVVHTWRAPEVA